MNNLIEARRIKRNYAARLRRNRVKRQSIHENVSQKACLDMITLLTEQDQKIQALGFRITENGKLTQITEAWKNKVEKTQDIFKQITSETTWAEKQKLLQKLTHSLQEES